MRNKRRSKLKNRLFSNTLLITLTISTVFLIYNLLLLKGIEDVLRYLFIALLAIIFVIYFLSFFTLKSKNKIKKTFFYFSLIILIILQFTLSYYICKLYNTLGDMSKNTVTYSTSIVVLNDNEIKTIDDLNDLTIGMINDKTSIDGYTISKSIIKDNNLNTKNIIEEYEDYYTMLDDLYNKTIDAVFLPSEYSSMFSSAEIYENIETKTFIVYTQTKEVVKKVTVTSTKKLTEPFTVLVMGIDSIVTDITNANSNADSLMLLTFNPDTLNTTILSIPRDSYVPISCGYFNKTNKITHSGWFGESCVEETIENFTGIDIDYYVKVDFKGIVDLVDALGDITVDVPFSFCEQNSKRQWGKNAISLEKGIQEINGEEALALARNRHKNPSNLCKSTWENWSSDDFVRGQNQQKILSAIIAKAKSIKDVNSIINVLNATSKHMDTNISTTQILSLYDVIKNIVVSKTSNASGLSFEQLYLNTTGAMIYDASFKHALSDQIIYPKSLAAVVKAMKINLELEEAELIKTFSFSINNPYEKVVPGKNITGSTGLVLVPDFIGKTKTEVETWCNKYNITLTAEYTDVTTGTQDTVLTQSAPYKTDVDTISKLSITIVNLVEAAEDVPTEVIPDAIEDTPFDEDITTDEDTESPDTPISIEE